MSFHLHAIVFAGLLFGGLVQTSPAADAAPLNQEVVQGLSLEALSKILASTDLRRLPLRLVLDEKVSSGDQEAPEIRHHVLMFDPGSKRLRYDRLDYGPSGSAPFVCSSFTDGVHSGRWESGLKPEDVPRILKGDSALVERRGMFYTGPNVCYSADILFRVMGLTMLGKPLAAWVGDLGDTTAITPDGAGDGLVLETSSKKIILDAHGVLRQFLFYSQPKEDKVTILESILVTETGLVGAIPVPTKMHRRVSFKGMAEESDFELRVADCRVITTQELAEATNPWISTGSVVIGGKNGLTLGKPMRAFGPVPAAAR
ncbi:hypothetical protein [Prosthecobacter sp.]|uniref:hypothetical protein n=1 Tax=Prosthecobacter sp. TaxID=1965333 RepID=UPI00378439B6